MRSFTDVLLVKLMQKARIADSNVKAESLSCDSPGWSELRERRPGLTPAEPPKACKALTPFALNPSRLSPLQGSAIPVI
jgi:hypothetical protein